MFYMMRIEFTSSDVEAARYKEFRWASSELPEHANWPKRLGCGARGCIPCGNGGKSAKDIKEGSDVLY